MIITISLNEAETAKSEKTGKTPDLSTLVRQNSKAEVVKVFGRGRFVSVEINPSDLKKLKSALGKICVFALRSEMTAFDEQKKSAHLDRLQNWLFGKQKPPIEDSAKPMPAE